jgi:NAD(P)-dependent dehydrogenase (short-subunit alcohol dehydrogenase family)
MESDLDVPADYATSIFRLDGRVAVVTGGAGGLGGAIASGFAQAGATVIIADRDIDRAEKRSTEIGREFAHAYEIDVTSATSVKDVVQNVTQNYGGVDVLVNSAGMATRHPAEDFPEDEWDLIMRVNVKGDLPRLSRFRTTNARAGQRQHHQPRLDSVIRRLPPVDRLSAEQGCSCTNDPKPRHRVDRPRSEGQRVGPLDLRHCADSRS